MTLNKAADWKMAEFFILATHRKQGIGRQAVNKILNQHPGLWEISILKDNEVAKHFWRKILLNSTEQVYNEYPEYIVFETST